MVMKTWVQPGPFIDAFWAAFHIYRGKYGEPFIPDSLERSIMNAWSYPLRRYL
jgi:hypothetical protein